MYVTSYPSNAPILVAILVTRDVQEIDVEDLNVSNQCLNISLIGAILFFLSMHREFVIQHDKQILCLA